MSKLGLHISSGKHDDGRGFGLGQALKQCAEAGHPLPVIFSVGQNVWPDVQRYSPQTVVIFRTQINGMGKTIGDGPGSIYTGDPVQTARAWMAEMMPVWAKNKAHYYAPLNEQDPGVLAGFVWLNAFTIECMNVAKANGYKLALYAFSGGNPKNLLGPTGEIVATADQCWQTISPSLQKAKTEGHILLLHEYGFRYGTLQASAPYLALRYRAAYSKLPADARPALVISEASADMGFTQRPDWLEDAKWYDGELMKDRAVMGCCLYQLGGKENLAQVLRPLADYIAATPTPVISTDPVEPPAPVGERYRVVCDRLNIRREPSVSIVIVGSLTKGLEFVVTEKIERGGFVWGKVNVGWVALRQIVEPLTERVG
jgi:hypothetical protein